MQKLLYFPGGPGFNANPEISLLKESYAAAGINLLGWNEPSQLRPADYPYEKENTYAHYLDCAEQFFLSHYSGEPLPLFCHCFGGQPLRHLIKNHPEKISRIVLASPSFNISKADKNILTFVMNDYRQQGDARADQLQDILKRYTYTFDANTQAGFWLVAENPRLFTAYWHNMDDMLRFLPFYSNEYGVDIEEYFDVRKSYFETPLQDCSIPVLAIYGRYDRIISIPDELEHLPRCFTDLQVAELTGSSHYPHIEKAGEVLDMIKKWLSLS